MFDACRNSLPTSEIRKKIPDISMPPEVAPIGLIFCYYVLCCCYSQQLMLLSLS